MFSLDYRTMSQNLQRMHYTGMAQATVPSGEFSGGTVCLQVRGGVLQACVVVMADGRQVSDGKVIAERLARAGLLEWHLTAAAPGNAKAPETAPHDHSTAEPTIPLPSAPPLSLDRQPPPPLPPSSSASQQQLSAQSYPRRAPVDPAWMSTWPFIYRQVYNLSTGQYSEQDIARLLRYPTAELIKVFNELQRMEVLQRSP